MVGISGIAGTQRPHFAGADERHGDPHLDEGRRNMPGDNIAEHRIIAAIGHMDHADASHGLQQLGKQVLDRPIAARAERQLARIVLGKRDEVGERVHA